MTEYIISTVATALLSGGLVQLLNLRSMKRIKKSEADLKGIEANHNEIENLRNIIDSQQKEIERLVERNGDLEKKYVALQHDFLTLSEEIRKKRKNNKKSLNI